MRYQEWWFTQFPKEFRDRGFEVLTIGEPLVELVKSRRSTFDMFSPINLAIKFECEQIKEYLSLELRDDDILFWADLSFPGIFGHILFHKRPKKMFAFCHATSLNKLDYFESDRSYKFPIETSIASMFDKVFIGSKYHQEKLGWENTLVTYLPFPPVYRHLEPITKTIEIISASRSNPQKIDEVLENLVEESFSEIKRPYSSTWFNYQWNLHSSKILLVTAYEDTFGYQIVDSVMNNCIPLARRDLAYPELLPDEFLYSSTGELMKKISMILNDNIIPQVPELLCKEQMNKFYDVICNEMKGNKEYSF